MTTYSYPTLSRVPNSMVLQYVSNTDSFRSPTTGAIQTVDRGGEHLVLTLTYNSLKTADRALLIGFIAKMNGMQHRVTLPFHAVDNQGAFGGTPIVNGASQTGNTLTVSGGSLSTTGWIKAGDVFSVNGEMKIATLDANTDGAGAITLTFSPRLRASPPNSDPIETTAPSGLFMLADSTQSWNYRPGDFSDIVLRFVEDIT
mgnify:FL=1